MNIRRLTVLASFVTLFFALTASAAGPFARLEREVSSGETVANFISKMERFRDASRASVIAVNWESWAFLIPAAGSVPGANNTYFRSDVTIANRKNVNQRITVAWFARGINNGNAGVDSFTINANTTVMERDFVAQVLGESGLGSILVVAVDSSGNIDETAQLDGFSRIWTPQPGSAGTVSQEFPSVEIEDTLATSYGYGLRQDTGYRTNVGLVNIWSTPNTYTVNVVGTGGNTSFTQNVQAYSMEQVPLPAGNWGDLYLRINSASSNFNWWSAYGVSVDNITGDGWISHVH